MRRYIYITTCLVLFSNCASLTKTQIESVNKFASSSKDFSDYPSKIITELADIRVERGLHYAITLSKPTNRVEELNSIHEQRNFDINISKEIDLTFKIIDKYAQSLAILSAQQTIEEAKISAIKFGVSLDSLIAQNNRIEKSPNIPVGIGGALGRIVASGGKHYMRIKQAKQVKKFVVQADTLIAIMTSNLLKFLESDEINELISGEERGLSSNYLSYIRHTGVVTMDEDRNYLQLKTKLDRVKELKQSTIRATKKLRASHKKLLEELLEKKKLKETIPELQDLFEEVKSLKTVLDKIEKNK